MNGGSVYWYAVESDEVEFWKSVMHVHQQGQLLTDSVFCAVVTALGTMP